MAISKRSATAVFVATLLFTCHVPTAESTQRNIAIGLSPDFCYDVCVNDSSLVFENICPSSCGIIAFTTTGASSVRIAPAGTVECAASTWPGVVRNGGYETGLPCTREWEYENHTPSGELSCDTGFSGASSAKVVTGQGGQYYQKQLKETGISVIAGEQYRLHFAAKSSIANRQIVVGLTNEENGMSVGLWIEPLLTGSWAEYDTTFTAIASADNCRFSFYVGTWDGTFWFDDVIIETLGEQGPVCPPDDGNLVQNARFECDNCLAGWQLEDHHQSGSLQCGAGYGGGHAASITSGQQGEYYETQAKQIGIPLVEGAPYYFRCWMKSAALGQPIVIGLTEEGNGIGAGLWLEAEPNIGWTLIEEEFTATRTTDNARLSFYVGWWAGTFFIDEVEIRSGSAPSAVDEIAVSPNPVEATGTTLSFNLRERLHVEVGVVDVVGRLVIREDLGELSAGQHRFAWKGVNANGQRAASGVYFAYVRTGRTLEKRRLIVVR